MCRRDGEAGEKNAVLARGAKSTVVVGSSVSLQTTVLLMHVTIQLVDIPFVNHLVNYACFGSTFEDFGQLSPFGCYGFQGRCPTHLLGLALVEGRACHDWTDLPQLRRD